MANKKMINLATNVFTDEKILLFEDMPSSDTLIIIWFKLLCLAGKTNDGGAIYLTKNVPYNKDMLSSVFNRPLTTINLALSAFESFGMIKYIDEIIYVSNWKKYQSPKIKEM